MYGAVKARCLTHEGNLSLEWFSGAVGDAPVGLELARLVCPAGGGEATVPKNAEELNFSHRREPENVLELAYRSAD
jgi:hypothetical protein